MSVQLSNNELAKAFAEKSAPLSKTAAVVAGSYGCMVTLTVLVVFVSIAGLEFDRFMWPTMIVCALGYALPFGYVWNLERKHYEAFRIEYNRLEKEHDAVRS